MLSPAIPKSLPTVSTHRIAFSWNPIDSLRTNRNLSAEKFGNLYRVVAETVFDWFLQVVSPNPMLICREILLVRLEAISDKQFEQFFKSKRLWVSYLLMERGFSCSFKRFLSHKNRPFCARNQHSAWLEQYRAHSIIVILSIHRDWESEIIDQLLYFCRYALFRSEHIYFPKLSTNMFASRAPQQGARTCQDFYKFSSPKAVFHTHNKIELNFPWQRRLLQLVNS